MKNTRRGVFAFISAVLDIRDNRLKLFLQFQQLIREQSRDVRAATLCIAIRSNWEEIERYSQVQRTNIQIIPFHFAYYYYYYYYYFFFSSDARVCPVMRRGES